MATKTKKEKNVEKAILKRTADALEKMAVGSAVAALFRDANLGVYLAIACIIASYTLTAWEAKR